MVMLCQDPSLLASLTPDQLAALSAISEDDLAPPPSQEEVFGKKVEELKSEFLEDKDRLEHQIAENQVRLFCGPIFPDF